jgi:DNA-binding transcriptional LysR family regulator
MNKFQAITVFVRVAESGGFTAAAGKLGMSVSAVTKAIARLEGELGTQLFTRTTRQLRTTDDGQEYYERCIRILSELEDAEIALQQNNAALKGRVRAVLPFSFGRVTVVPELPNFCARYPDITLELNFSDGPVDIISEGYDVAVRTGEISDSRLTTRLLMHSLQVTVASPSYLAKHGTPKTPEDLKHHNCIVGRFGPEWTFRRSNGRRFAVRVQGNTVINSGDALREAAVAGLGIIQGTWWLVRQDIEHGDVQSILTDYALEGTPISLLYPGNRHLPRKTRAFLDFLIEITRTS